MQKTYKLSKTLNHVAAMDSTFGPTMTLAQAVRYQADMTLAGFNVTVVNLATGIDYAMKSRGKGWQKSIALTI